MDALSIAERDKYQRMWAVDEYRVRSIGSDLVYGAFTELGMRPHQTLTDYGCGTGRAALEFAGLGLRVTAIDIAVNAISPQAAARLQFIVASLWQLPAGLPATDWAYCTDVLEHIPESQVDAVLEAIALRTGRGAFLTISHQPDRFGALIGETLHVTVKPPAWWEARLLWAFGEHFTHTITTESGSSEVVLKRRTD